MQKVNVYKCPQCGAKYKSLQTWGNHMSAAHPELIPSGWSYARYFYYVQTGKSSGKCVVCKKETKWNEATKKYERFCENPKCKEIYREEFKKRMIKKYGKVNLLNDPEQQRKMLANRKISGLYTFRNGKQIAYVGSYENDFLFMLDRFLYFDPNDIMMPSPHTYEYEYKNPEDKLHEGKHFYIPDAYIPSLNLEIEIKQNSNKHPKILKIDKIKEEQKDDVMNSIPDIKYIKIVEKDYTNFFNLIENLSNTITDKEMVANENLLIYSISNKPYKQGNLKLKDFKSMNLDKLTMEAFQKQVPEFKKRYKPTYGGEIILNDKGEVVGFYKTEKVENCVWLQSFLIKEEYSGKGLEDQLLKRSINRYKVTNVKVEIKDEMIIDLMRSYGFVEYNRDKTFLLMRII